MVNDDSGEGIFIVTSNSLCYMDKSGVIRILDNFPYYNNYNVVNGNNDNIFVLGSAGIYVADKNALLSGKELDYKLLNVSAIPIILALSGISSPLRPCIYPFPSYLS
jgi:hypothetical protein